MQLKTILTASRCCCGVTGGSKKRLLTKVSELISADINYLPANTIYDALTARERLGSTGIGNGIAIPHCRVPKCREITGAFISLEKAIDFDAIDGKPVDLIFVLLVPDQETGDHLQVLSALAGLFQQDAFCKAARNARSHNDLYEAAISY